MARTIILYALALAALAALLQWLQYRYLARAFPGEFYAAILAALFILLGIWVGRRFTPPPTPGAEFRRNDRAIRSLRLTPRECDILDQLASGQSNKEMARALSISPNTIKSHVARVYEKLAVRRRV